MFTNHISPQFSCVASKSVPILGNLIESAPLDRGSWNFREAVKRNTYRNKKQIFDLLCFVHCI